MPTGRVTVFDEERRFGFIQPIDGGRDVFVHADEVEGDDDSLRPGDIVEYEVAEDEDDDELQATGVTISERAPEDNPSGRIVTGGPPPTWDRLNEIERELRSSGRRRRRRR